MGLGWMTIQREMSRLMFGWHGPMMFALGGFILMKLIWVLFVIGIIYFVVRIARSGSWHRMDRMDGYGTSSRALDILKERYARGEIDADTYNRMKDELK